MLFRFVIAGIVVDVSRELKATQLFMLELSDWSNDQINRLELVRCPIFGIIEHLAGIVVAFLCCDRGQRAEKMASRVSAYAHSTSHEKTQFIVNIFVLSIFSYAHSSLYACARVRVSTPFSWCSIQAASRSHCSAFFYLVDIVNGFFSVTLNKMKVNQQRINWSDLPSAGWLRRMWTQNGRKTIRSKKRKSFVTTKMFL